MKLRFLKRLVPDIMHDVLEGCLAYEMKEIINYAVSGVIFSLNDLNDSVSLSPYFGVDARNKPSPIATNIMLTSDHGLKQSRKYCCF